MLRRALWAAGLRYRKDFGALPGRPDVVLVSARVAVFCDGDFWHGRNWQERRRRLSGGHNAPYWVAKIERNMARDRERVAALEASGWAVLRYWETDILKKTDEIVAEIVATVRGRTRS